MGRPLWPTNPPFWPTNPPFWLVFQDFNDPKTKVHESVAFRNIMLTPIRERIIWQSTSSLCSLHSLFPE